MRAALVITTLVFAHRAWAQSPTDSLSKAYRTGCYAGVEEAQNVLADLAQRKNELKRRGYATCDSSLVRLAATDALRLEHDAGRVACRSGIRDIFERYGVGGEIAQGSDRLKWSYADCLYRLWDQNLLSPDSQTEIAPSRLLTLLRHLILAEEAFYGDSVGYTATVTHLELKIPPSVRASVRITGDGYRATVTYSSVLSCHVFVGAEGGVPGRKEGEPWCDQ